MRRHDWVKTQGKIESVYVDGGGEGETVSAVFTYEVNGHVYGGTYTMKLWQNMPVVGSPISLKYDPKDPNRNDLVVSETRWNWFIGLLVALSVLGVLLEAIEAAAAR